MSLPNITFCLLLACARNLVKADRSVTDDKHFDFGPFKGMELRGKVLGVIGTGKIGIEVIRIAKGFGMQVVAFDIYQNDRSARTFEFSYMPLEALLEISDFITIHMPLTQDTENLIDRTALRRMKKGSVLINTARGKIVDELALKEALDSGHLRAAGLDVIEDETDPENDILLRSEKVTITPHIGFFTEESMNRMLDGAIDTIQAFRSGKIINQVPSSYMVAPKERTLAKDLGRP